jgi:hypothetical protein
MNNTFKSAEQAFNNFDMFLKNIVGNDNLQIELTVEVDNYNSDPEFTIQLNDSVLYNNTLSQGTHKIVVDASTSESNCLTMTMTGKDQNDTLVENGNIVRDKFIKLVDFKINNFDILEDTTLFHNKFWYAVDSVVETVKPGFWNNNSCLGLEFTAPFTIWYQRESTSNTALADSLKFQNTSNHAKITAQVIENIKKLTY